MAKTINNILQENNNIESDLLSRSKDIIKVLFFLDLGLLLLGIFQSSKSFLIISLVINLILLGSYLVIQKYYMFFEVMIQSQKLSKNLNAALGSLNG